MPETHTVFVRSASKDDAVDAVTAVYEDAGYDVIDHRTFSIQYDAAQEAKRLGKKFINDGGDKDFQMQITVRSGGDKQKDAGL